MSEDAKILSNKHMTPAPELLPENLRNKISQIVLKWYGQTIQAAIGELLALHDTPYPDAGEVERLRKVIAEMKEMIEPVSNQCEIMAYSSTGDPSQIKMMQWFALSAGTLKCALSLAEREGVK